MNPMSLFRAALAEVLNQDVFRIIGVDISEPFDRYMVNRVDYLVLFGIISIEVDYITVVDNCMQWIMVVLLCKRC